MKEEEKFVPFKEGDKVYCLMHGNGVVMDIYEGGNYPIKVRFEDGINWYTFDGKWDTNCNRTLYHGHDLEVIVKEELPKRKQYVNLYWNKETGNIFTGKIIFSEDNYFKGSDIKNIKFLKTVEIDI